ncbi:MAG: sigma-70 family RNA polymerase sigma factor [Planctomycetota bacterium]
MAAQTTSPSLLMRLRNPQDSTAWREFEELYSGIIRLYCRKRRLQPHDEDDVVQEVMNVISRAIKTFEYDPSKGRFRSWLGTVVANKINNHLGRKTGDNLAASGEEAIHHSIGNCEDPDDGWIEVFSEQIFRKACSIVRPSVSNVTWACFEMTWIECMDANEAGQQLNIPVHSVYVNKSRVLKRLDREIKILAEDLPVAKEDII